jgi:hypothetical protein
MSPVCTALAHSVMTGMHGRLVVTHVACLLMLRPHGSDGCGDETALDNRTRASTHLASWDKVRR